MGPNGDQLSARRAAKNQALFREVNERMNEFQSTTSPIEFICECADDTCTERIPVLEDEYEAVRHAGGRFLVTPGHVFPEFESVVSDSQRFQVVEKTGEAGRVAEKLDPRTRPTKISA